MWEWNDKLNLSRDTAFVKRTLHRRSEFHVECLLNHPYQTESVPCSSRCARCC